MKKALSTNEAIDYCKKEARKERIRQEASSNPYEIREHEKRVKMLSVRAELLQKIGSTTTGKSCSINGERAFITL